MVPVAPDSGKTETEEEGREKRGGEGKMRCSNSRRSWWEEREVGAAMAGPIYRLAMLVLAMRYFLAH
jgi:hypothetical protein